MPSRKGEANSQIREGGQKLTGFNKKCCGELGEGSILPKIHPI